MTTPQTQHPLANDTLVRQLLDPAQLQNDLHIIKANLSDALIRQAGLYCHYAQISVEARRQMDSFKARLELVTSGLNRAYRKTLTDEARLTDPKAKITVDQIDAAVKLDANYVRLAQAVIDAEAVFRLSEAAVFSFVQRKDMLVQLSRADGVTPGYTNAAAAGQGYLAARAVHGAAQTS